MKRLSILIATATLLTFSAAAHAQDWAKARLEKSPRHLEFVKVKQGKREVNSFIGFPEVKEKATAIVLIHEIFGLSDWVRGMCDQFAEAGYIAIAPDLLSGTAPNGGGTAELGGGDAVRGAIRSLPQDQVTADLNAVVEYVSKLPACNGKVVVAGFCWGGGQTFRFATNNKNIKAGMVFYGSFDHTAEDVAKIQCPIYGFYGENDNRINASIPKSEELMKAAKKTYEPVTYKGAGHGFMRAGEEPEGNADNKKGREDAWKRIKEIMKKV